MVGRKAIDETGNRHGKLLVIERAEKDKNGKQCWLCRCDCGNEVTVKGTLLRRGDTRSCGCSRSPDLIGQRFGNLVVQERVGSDKRGNSRWLCRCDCGNEIYVTNSRLSAGRTKSCGCLKRKVLLRRHRERSLVGKRFGYLVAIERTAIRSDKHTRTYYLCRCDCGNKVVTHSSSLTTGHTKSCGCLAKELLVERGKEKSLVGQRFGTLVATERKVINKSSCYLCLCDCGNKKWVRSQNLQSGGTKSCGCRNHLSGPDSHSWNPKLTDAERTARRKNPQYLEWRSTVKERDDYTCRLCGNKGHVNAHHLEDWSTNEALRYEVSNGITLCEEDHTLFHLEYGYGNNTRTQFEEFRLRYKHGDNLA